MSRLSGNFSDYQENIQTIRKLARLCGNFQDHPENIQIIRKLSRLSGNLQGNPETFRTIRKISRPSGNFQGLRAQTFRMAMPPCHQGFWGLCCTQGSWRFTQGSGRLYTRKLEAAHKEVGGCLISYNLQLACVRKLRCYLTRIWSPDAHCRVDRSN